MVSDFSITSRAKDSAVTSMTWLASVALGARLESSIGVSVEIGVEAGGSGGACPRGYAFARSGGPGEADAPWMRG